MSNFEIGISGIKAAHTAMSTIGNNIANVATEGYHRQRVNLLPEKPAFSGILSIGQGVETIESTRLIDYFLENTILKQSSAGQQYSKELSVLQTIENTLGDMSDVGLNTIMGDFFNSLKELASDPQNNVDQNAVINNAIVLSNQFKTIGTFLGDIDTQIFLNANDCIAEINSLSKNISDMNALLGKLDITGIEAGSLRDKRDQAVAEIAKLVGIKTQLIDDGATVNVFLGSIPLVLNTTYTDIEVSKIDGDLIGISVAGNNIYTTDVTGGTLGGLMEAKNNHLKTLKEDLDTLALNLITSINEFHVQGVPSYNQDTGIGGSFTSLEGWPMINGTLDSFTLPVTDGTISMRVIDSATGVVKRHTIDVDADVDTLASIAAKIDAIDDMNASIKNSGLYIESDAGYKFDFVTAPLPKATPTLFSTTFPLGTSTPSVSGVYTGTDNQNYTMTIVGDATIGTDAFDVQVRDIDNVLVETINVGAGYVAGEKLTTTSGVEISFGAGTVVDTESFQVTALSSPLVTGHYTGSTDETYTCTVVGNGDIGITDGLKLKIEDGSGNPATFVNIGSGYVAGETVWNDVNNDIQLKMDIGTLIDGQVFKIEALADSDTSGFLASTGINTFFKGHSASSIGVNDAISDNPAKLAVSMGNEMVDEKNISRISNLSEQPMSALGQKTLTEYYRSISNGLAQKIRVVSLNESNSEQLMLQLRTQRDKISGVDINNEAAELMVYEQMFQAMSKYMNIVKESMEDLMQLI